MIKRNAKNLFILSSALLLLAGCVQVQHTTGPYKPYQQAKPQLAPAPLPEYVPGEFYTFNDVTVVATKVRKGKVKWDFSNGASGYAHSDFTLPMVQWKNDNRKRETDIQISSNSLWPLSVGKRATFTTNTRVVPSNGPQDNGNKQWQCMVVDTETVTVPVGTFDTYKISCEAYSSFDQTLISTVNYYYSPDFGHYVKMERTGIQGAREQVLTDAGYNNEYLPSAEKRKLQYKIEEAMTKNPDGEPSYWKSGKQDVSLIVTPVSTYAGENGRKCRAYRAYYDLGGKSRLQVDELCQYGWRRWKK